MIETILSRSIVTGAGCVTKLSIDMIDEIQTLSINAQTTINLHDHPYGQWEVWINLDKKEVLVCLSGEKHCLSNNSNNELSLLAIKGHSDLNYQEFEQFFSALGLTVLHSLFVVYN